MRILHDMDADALWEVLRPAYDGREGAVFSALAAWFRKVGEHIGTELNRAPPRLGEVQDFEKWLIEMQREIHALSTARGVVLPAPRPRPDATRERINALVAEVVETLEYLSLRPEFADEAAGRGEN